MRCLASAIPGAPCPPIRDRWETTPPEDGLLTTPRFLIENNEMQDANDLFYFAKVVQHGGFSAAARILHVTKSSLSKRVARLEDQLGTRLIERSTRAFRVTAVGEDVFAQCEGIVAGVEGAEAVAMRATTQPRGVVRFACPPGMVNDAVSMLLPGFLLANPEVRVALAVSNRRVDLVEDGFDLALRVRERLDSDAALVVRKIGLSHRMLVASPSRFAAQPAMETLTELSRAPLLTIGDEIKQERWQLIANDGREETIDFLPTLASSDFRVLLDAAIAGVGIALIPQNICRPAISNGTLLYVLPDWQSQASIIHMVFTTRRGLLPATRALVDYIAEHLPSRL